MSAYCRFRNLTSFLLLALTALACATGEDPSSYTAVCEVPSTRYRAKLCSDTPDTMVVAWEELSQVRPANAAAQVFALDESTSTSSQVRVQRFDRNQQPVWSPCGIPLTPEAGWSILVGVVGAPDGGALVASREETGVEAQPYQLKVQKLDSQGTPIWTQGGVIVTATDGIVTECQAVSDGAGGLLLSWSDSTSIRAQRVDAGGNVMWDAAGKAVRLETNGSHGYLVMTEDGSGGAVLAWAKSGDSAAVYAQRISGAGDLAWHPDAVRLTTRGGDHVMSGIAADGLGGAFVTWTAMDNTGLQAWGQKVSAAGAVQWGELGLDICKTGNIEPEVGIAPDGAGGAFIAWRDTRNSGSDPSNSNIFAQRFDVSGAPVWPGWEGIAVCEAPDNQHTLQVRSDGAGGALVAWLDERYGTPAAYVQRITHDGSAWWTRNGKMLSHYLEGAFGVAVELDKDGGAWFAWAGFDTSGANLFAGRVAAHGPVPPEADLLFQEYIVPTVQGRWKTRRDHAVCRVQARVLVKNAGVLRAGPFRVAMYMSADPYLDAGDQLLARRIYRKLLPNLSRRVKISARWKAPAPSSAYVLLVLDPDNAVPESDEVDNTRAYPLPTE